MQGDRKDGASRLALGFALLAVIAIYVSFGITLQSVASRAVDLRLPGATENENHAALETTPHTFSVHSWIT